MFVCVPKEIFGCRFSCFADFQLLDSYLRIKMELYNKSVFLKVCPLQYHLGDEWSFLVIMPSLNNSIGTIFKVPSEVTDDIINSYFWVGMRCTSKKFKVDGRGFLSAGKLSLELILQSLLLLMVASNSWSHCQVAGILWVLLDATSSTTGVTCTTGWETL